MPSKSTEEHKSKAPLKVRVAVVTISDSKYAYHWTGEKGVENEDISGKKIQKALTAGGHDICFYTVIPDHAGMIIETIDHAVEVYCPDAIITTGGTGLGPRDVTIETLEPEFDKILTGFGEVFRYESMNEIGTAAMLSRATAGTYDGTMVFCLPGSPNACETGTKLILKELGHIVKHIKE